MKKQIFTILFSIFSLLISAQTGKVHAVKSIPDSPSSSTISNVEYPKDFGMNAKWKATIDSIVKDGIESKAFPGCEVLILKEGKPYYSKCFGYYTYDSTQKVEPTTMYDLASMTKTTATLLAIMKLYDDKKLNLTDKASEYLSFLKGTDKENITITDLLFHESGLPAGLPFYKLILKEKDTIAPTDAQKKDSTIPIQTEENASGLNNKFKEGSASLTYSDEFSVQVAENLFITKNFHQEAMQMIAKAKLHDKTYVYSDLNFILLKEIAETISGMDLDKFVNEGFYNPMKLNHISYLPLRLHKKEEIAPTVVKDFIRGNMAQGYVHDGSGAFFGGISGNAGLFADAGDVAKVFQMILNGGEIDGVRYISEETCKLFTTTTSASGRRGLGFDKPVPSNPRINPCSISAPTAVYGHTGYTGTCYWVDPINKLVYVFLSNRTYPGDANNKLSKMGIRGKIQEVMYQSIK
jgi:CubicO group peptidase (beta-lactamase class C family)